MVDKDEALLKSWNFLNKYHELRPKLIALAKGVYIVLKSLLGDKISPQDCGAPFIDVLNQDSDWQKVLGNKVYARPVLHKTFTESMARYVLEKEWSDISS